MRILFLDDCQYRHDEMDKRNPDDEIIHAKTIWDFLDALNKYDYFDKVSLDHDLNDYDVESIIDDREVTGVDACGLMMQHRKKLPTIIDIHSSNGNGARAMIRFLKERGIETRWKFFELVDDEEDLTEYD